MKSWFDNPQELVKNDKVLEFWPTGEQTPEERVNAATRFIVYVCCAIYLIRRDPRIFILGMTALGVIYVLYTSQMVREEYKEPCNSGVCHKPTRDNPMGNTLISDYTDAPNRLDACYYASSNSQSGNRIPYDSGAGRNRSPMAISRHRNAFERQFVTNPVSKIPGGEQTEFAEWLYGPKNGPSCKSNTRFCDTNARGVQLEAFGGLNDGNKRSGMFGGGNGSA